MESVFYVNNTIMENNEIFGVYYDCKSLLVLKNFGRSIRLMVQSNALNIKIKMSTLPTKWQSFLKTYIAFGSEVWGPF